MTKFWPVESLYHLFLLSSRIQIRSESASTIHSPVRDDCLSSRNGSTSTWMTFVSSFMFHLDLTLPEFYMGATSFILPMYLILRSLSYNLVGSQLLTAAPSLQPSFDHFILFLIVILRKRELDCLEP